MARLAVSAIFGAIQVTAQNESPNILEKADLLNEVR